MLTNGIIYRNKNWQEKQISTKRIELNYVRGRITRLIFLQESNDSRTKKQRNIELFGFVMKKVRQDRRSDFRKWILFLFDDQRNDEKKSKCVIDNILSLIHR